MVSNASTEGSRVTYEEDSDLGSHCDGCVDGRTWERSCDYCGGVIDG